MGARDISSLEKSIGYVFKNKKLLIEALSHPSSKNGKERALDYERLEMLGDSILNFIISEALFKKFPESEEGKLAKTRSYLVSGPKVAEIASSIGLGDYILLGRGEEISGGRTREGNSENAMEALVASVYLDGGLEEARVLVLSLWGDLSENMDPRLIDPKSRLQEWAQEKGLGIPGYKETAKTGSAHNPFFTVSAEVGGYSASASAGSLKSAQKAAARKLIEYLKI